MIEFKVGDEVRSLKDQPLSGISKGDLGLVLKVTSNKLHCKVMWTRIYEPDWASAFTLELVPQTESNSASTCTAPASVSELTQEQLVTMQFTATPEGVSQEKLKTAELQVGDTVWIQDRNGKGEPYGVPTSGKIVGINKHTDSSTYHISYSSYMKGGMTLIPLIPISYSSPDEKGQVIVFRTLEQLQAYVPPVVCSKTLQLEHGALVRVKDGSPYEKQVWKVEGFLNNGETLRLSQAEHMLTAHIIVPEDDVLPLETKYYEAAKERFSKLPGFKKGDIVKFIQGHGIWEYTQQQEFEVVRVVSESPLGSYEIGRYSPGKVTSREYLSGQGMFGAWELYKVGEAAPIKTEAPRAKRAVKKSTAFPKSTADILAPIRKQQATTKKTAKRK